MDDYNIIWTEGCATELCSACLLADENVHEQNGDLFYGDVILADDGRGYTLQMAETPYGDQRFAAGCRRFTYKEAVAHWSFRQTDKGLCVDDRKAARRLLLAVLKNRDLGVGTAPLASGYITEGDAPNDVRSCEECHEIISHYWGDCSICNRGCSTDETDLWMGDDSGEGYILVCDGCADEIVSAYQGAVSTDDLVDWMQWRTNYRVQRERAEQWRIAHGDRPTSDTWDAFGVWWHHVELRRREALRYATTLVEMAAA